MEKDDAIYTLERLAHTEAKWPGTEETLEALDMAVKALRLIATVDHFPDSTKMIHDSDFVDTNKMVPLTLEQLREMDGKPVYWKNTDLWCLAGAGKIILPTGISYPVRDMPGQFYAYPPAHIDRETWTAEWVDNDQSEEMMCKCSKCGYPVSYFWGKTAFCPGCGKAMTPDAWDELEKRLRG